MKRTMSYVTAVLAPAALIPLMMGCTSQRPVRPTPTTPPAEPGAPSMQQPARPAEPQGPTGQMGKGQIQQQPGEPGREQEAQPKEQLGSGLGQPERPSPEQGEQAMSDKAICDALAQSAKLRVEDVQHGVAIMATPKGDADVSTVRDDARRLSATIQKGAEPHADRGESCGLAELGRLPSVTVQMSEGGQGVRILMTTSNPSEVKDLRRMAREEIGVMTRGQAPEVSPHPRPRP
jgi:hypothetical protein